jgi:class 3 adenylate cyclase
MQQAMRQFATVTTAGGSVVSLAVKAAVASGPARRFLVGDPQIQLLDVLAGAILDRMAAAEQQARKGEVLLDWATAQAFGEQAVIAEWRIDDETGARFAVLADMQQPAADDVQRSTFNVQRSTFNVPPDILRPFLLPPIYSRLSAGQGAFLAELRPTVALFMGFGGIDYDGDDQAGARLDAYVRWVQGVLARHDAYVLQLTMGDKGGYLYTSFGAPQAHDDDPARAVAAALALLSPPPEPSAVQGVRIGISRGRMRTGAYGGATRRTYGALGDEVNLAARLMAKAQPGQILVSGAVANATGELYQLESIGQLAVKGKQAPVPVLVGRGPRAPEEGRALRTFAHPLVGREQELERLAGLLDAALAGAGQVLLIEGPAGIGKSHLAATLAERALRCGARVGAGACQRISNERAYAVWGDAFRSLFGLAGTPGDQVAYLEALVGAANPDWLLRLPLLGDLLDLPISDNPTTAAFEPRLRQEALFALVADLVQTWARSRPLLLLLEDTHWMDEVSSRLTLALARTLPSYPVALLLVQRPALEEDHLLSELSRTPSFQRLELDELAPEGVAALVSNRLAGPLDPLARR